MTRKLLLILLLVFTCGCLYADDIELDGLSGTYLSDAYLTTEDMTVEFSYTDSITFTVKNGTYEVTPEDIIAFNNKELDDFSTLYRFCVTGIYMSEDLMTALCQKYLPSYLFKESK